jgi:hypothetical protein
MSKAQALSTEIAQIYSGLVGIATPKFGAHRLASGRPTMQKSQETVVSNTPVRI